MQWSGWGRGRGRGDSGDGGRRARGTRAEGDGGAADDVATLAQDLRRATSDAALARKETVEALEAASDDDAARNDAGLKTSALIPRQPSPCARRCEACSSGTGDVRGARDFAGPSGGAAGAPPPEFLSSPRTS